MNLDKKKIGDCKDNATITTITIKDMCHCETSCQWNPCLYCKTHICRQNGRNGSCDNCDEPKRTCRICFQYFNTRNSLFCHLRTNHKIDTTKYITLRSPSTMIMTNLFQKVECVCMTRGVYRCHIHM
jgi:hypothetical protein